MERSTQRRESSGESTEQENWRSGEVGKSEEQGTSCSPDYDDETPAPVYRSISYYLLPCYFLFYRSDKLLNLVLNKMGSLVTEEMSHFSCATDCCSRINAIVSVVLLMHEDAKIRKILSSCKAEIDLILQNLLLVQ
ncbi:hypothetical protein U1Q18_017627, partial [Sarracenia purpurea var. burkii]